MTDRASLPARLGLTVGSLFSGIGGLDLGFERAGFRVVWQCERDPFCRAVLAKHWPGVPCLEDVHDVSAGSVPGVDVLIGGFPCQPVSCAGKRRGHNDERWLWPEMFRIVREMRPGWICAENVHGLRTLGADRVIEDLESEGYAVWPLVVGADDVGAPHRRKRVFIVAHHARVPEQQKRTRDERTVFSARPRANGSTDATTLPTQPFDGRAIRASGCDVAHRDSGRRELIGQPEPRRLERPSGDELDRCDMPLADAASRGLGERRGSRQARYGGDAHGVSPMEHTSLAGLGRVREGLLGSPSLDDADMSRSGVARQADSRRGIYGSRESTRRAAWPASPGAEQHGWEPPRCVTRVESGLGDLLDGLPWRLAPWARRHALRALGNAVVPQVAEVIGRAIRNAMPIPAQTELFG